MKKYVVIDGAVTANAAQYEEICDTEEEALATAERDWTRLTKAEKAKRDYFYVASADVDEDGIINFDTAKTIMQYK